MYMSVGMSVLLVIELQGAGVLAPLAIFVAPIVNCEFLEVQGCKTYLKKNGLPVPPKRPSLKSK